MEKSHAIIAPATEADIQAAGALMESVGGCTGNLPIWLTRQRS